jgi:hypothetical protein
MKNQYVADVNDFRKYGLIRGLAEGNDLRTAVCWMLTPDDWRADGRKTRFWNPRLQLPRRKLVRELCCRQRFDAVGRIEGALAEVDQQPAFGCGQFRNGA